MVARNFAGLSISFISRFAFLPPSSAILRIFPSLTEMTAISLAAKKALTAISTISKSILSNMPVNSPSPETCEAVSTAEAPAKTGIILPPSIWVPVVFSFQINTRRARKTPAAGHRLPAGDRFSTNYHITIYTRFCQVKIESAPPFRKRARLFAAQARVRANRSRACRFPRRRRRVCRPPKRRSRRRSRTAP